MQQQEELQVLKCKKGGSGPYSSVRLRNFLCFTVEATGLGFVCFVVLNPPVLLAIFFALPHAWFFKNKICVCFHLFVACFLFGVSDYSVRD